MVLAQAAGHPVVGDDAVFSHQPFFKGEPTTLMAGYVPNLPIMMGITKDEGILSSGSFVRDKEVFKRFRDNWKTCGPSNLFGIRREKVTDEISELTEQVRQFYLGDEVMDLDMNFSNITDMLSDAMFAYGTDYTVRSLRRRGGKIKGENHNNPQPLYYYMFSHVGGFSLGDVFASTPLELVSTVLRNALFGYDPTSSKRLGVSHGDDVLYLFSLPIPGDLLPTEDDKAASNIMVDMWVNFATYGKPIPGRNEMLDGGLTSLQSLVSNDTLFKPPRRLWKPAAEQSEDQRKAATGPRRPSGYVRIIDDLIVPYADAQFDRRMEFWERLFG